MRTPSLQLIAGTEYRVLSVRQPAAWAILHAGKDVENRGRNIHYRGPLLIHASAHTPRSRLEEDLEMIQEFTGFRPGESQLVYGAILGMVQLVGCVWDSRSPWAFPDCAHWLVSEPRALSAPIAARGALNLWRWTAPGSGAGQPPDARPARRKAPAKVRARKSAVQTPQTRAPETTHEHGLADATQDRRRRSAATDYLQYEKRDAGSIESAKRFAIYTSKSVRALPGKRVWLLKRTARGYVLAFRFTVDDTDEDGDANEASGPGEFFGEQVRVDTLPWFRDLQHHCGNFGLGLLPLPDHFVRHMEDAVANANGDGRRAKAKKGRGA